MFWLVKKSKKRTNLVGLKTKFKYFIESLGSGYVENKKKPIRFRRRRVSRGHLRAVRQLRVRIKKLRSRRLYFFKRRRRYRRYWRKVFIRKLGRAKAKVPLYRPKCDKRKEVRFWKIRTVTPLAVFKGVGGASAIALPLMYYRNTGSGCVQFKPNQRSKTNRPLPVRFGTFRRPRRSVVKKLRWGRRRRLRRWIRKNNAYARIVKKRARFIKKKNSRKIKRFKYKARVRLFRCGITSRVALSSRNLFRGHGRGKLAAYGKHRRPVSAGTRQVSKYVGRLVKAKLATNHFYSQNISRGFEFDNWTFWEEFIPEMDHSRNLGAKILPWSTVNCVAQVVSRSATKTNGVSGPLGTAKHTGTKFLMNRSLVRSGAKAAFYLNSLVRLYTLRRVTWTVLLRLLHLTMNYIYKHKAQMNTRGLIMLKQALCLITELDCLVISRIESGVLPSYQMDRSTTRGYSSMRRRFISVKRYLRELRLAPRGVTSADPHLHGRNSMFLKPLLVVKKKNHIFNKRRRRYKIAMRRLRTDKFLKRFSLMFIVSHWRRGHNFRRFSEISDKNKPRYHRRLLIKYLKKYPRRRIWRIMTKRRIWFKKRSRRWFFNDLKGGFLGGNREVVNFFIKKPKMPINSATADNHRQPVRKDRRYLHVGTRTVKPKWNFYRNRADTINAQLLNIKKKIPKFRVKKKLRNIKLRSIIKVIKKRLWSKGQVNLVCSSSGPNSVITRSKRVYLKDRATSAPDGTPQRQSIRVQPTDYSSQYRFDRRRRDGIVLSTEPVPHLPLPKRPKRRYRRHKHRSRKYFRKKPVRIFRYRRGGRISLFMDYWKFLNGVVREAVLHPHSVVSYEEELMHHWDLPQPYVPKVTKLRQMKTPKDIENVLKDHKPWGISVKSGTRFGALVKALGLSTSVKRRRRRRRWLSPKAKASYMQGHRAGLSMGLLNLNLRVVSSLGIKLPFRRAINELTSSFRVLPLGFRRFFNKSKYIFTIMLLMVYVDVSVWSSYLNRLFFRTKPFRQRRMFNSLRALLPRTARVCGLYASVRGMYMSFKGKVASRGGLRKRVLRVGYGWYSSANFGIQHRYKFKQVWSKSGAIGLKTIITCGNMHRNPNKLPGRLPNEPTNRFKSTSN